MSQAEFEIRQELYERHTIGVLIWFFPGGRWVFQNFLRRNRFANLNSESNFQTLRDGSVTVTAALHLCVLRDVLASSIPERHYFESF